MKEVGAYRNFIDCTSRGSGKNVEEIEPNGHKPCVECVPWPVPKRTGIWKELSDKDELLAIGKYVVFDYVGLPNEKHGVWKYYDGQQNLKELVYFDQGEIIKTVSPGKLNEFPGQENLKAWFKRRKPKDIDIQDFYVLEAIRTQNLDLFKQLIKLNLIDLDILRYLQDLGLIVRNNDDIVLSSLSVTTKYLEGWHFTDQFLPGSHLFEILAKFDFSPYFSINIWDAFEKYAQGIDFRIDKHSWIVYLITSLEKQNIEFNSNYLFWTQFERILDSFEAWKKLIPNLISFEEFHKTPCLVGFNNQKNTYHLRNIGTDFKHQITNYRSHDLFAKTYQKQTKTFRKLEELSESENLKSAYEKNSVKLKYNSILEVCQETSVAYTWSAITDYYSTKKITRQTPEFAKENRKIILDELKTGLAAKQMGKILYQAIQNTPNGALKQALDEQPIVLPIPASSIEKNNRRFKPLVESFCECANVENGFNLAIPAEEGRKAQHLTEENVHLSAYITIDQHVRNRVVIVLDDVRSQGRSTRAMHKKLIKQGAKEVHFIYFGLSVNYSNRYFKEEFDEVSHVHNFSSFNRAYFKTRRNEYYCELVFKSSKGNFFYRRLAYLKAQSVDKISAIGPSTKIELIKWQLEVNQDSEVRYLAHFLDTKDQECRVLFSEIENKENETYVESYLTLDTKYEGVQDVRPTYQKANLLLPKNSILHLTDIDE